MILVRGDGELAVVRIYTAGRFHAFLFTGTNKKPSPSSPVLSLGLGLDLGLGSGIGLSLKYTSYSSVCPASAYVGKICKTAPPVTKPQSKPKPKSWGKWGLIVLHYYI